MFTIMGAVILLIFMCSLTSRPTVSLLFARILYAV